MLAVAVLMLLSRPWLETGTAALDFSPFDLAEWLTLVPDVRFGSDELTTPLLIRLVHALVFCAVTLLPRRMFGLGWWCVATIGVLGSLMLLPPIEFFIRPEFRADPNYGQLVQVTLISLGLVAIGLSPIGRRFRRPLGALVMVAVVVCAWLTTQTASAYLATQSIPHTPTVALFCGCALGAALAFLIPSPKR